MRALLTRNLARLELICPAYYVGTVTKMQLHSQFDQLLDGGNMSVSSMLDLERYMTWLKSWARSRKNVAAGLIKSYGLAQQVALARLTQQDLVAPPGYRHEKFIQLPTAGPVRSEVHVTLRVNSILERVLSLYHRDDHLTPMPPLLKTMYETWLSAKPAHRRCVWRVSLRVGVTCVL